MSRRIYLASSWRNQAYPVVLNFLREAGHEVYDFRQPRPGERGFHWSEIDPEWQSWRPSQFLAALNHPIAGLGFVADLEGMEWADTFVLLLPCGRSAHLELGWAIGRGVPAAIYLQDSRLVEAELMYKLADQVLYTPDALADWLERLELEAVV